MSKNIVSLFLSLLFVVFVLTPTLITLVDKAADISVFFEISDEEEKSVEKDGEAQEYLYELHQQELTYGVSGRRNVEAYLCITYPNPHLNIISPPPEAYIL